MGSNKVMVCVTQQKTCERLIYYGRRLVDGSDNQLHVINVVEADRNFLGNNKESEALEYLFGVSRDAGAEMTVIRSDDIAQSIIGFVKKNGIHHIVLGEPDTKPSENNIIEKLMSALPKCEFYIIQSREE